MIVSSTAIPTSKKSKNTKGIGITHSYRAFGGVSSSAYAWDQNNRREPLRTPYSIIRRKNKPKALVTTLSRPKIWHMTGTKNEDISPTS